MVKHNLKRFRSHKYASIKPALKLASFLHRGPNGQFCNHDHLDLSAGKCSHAQHLAIAQNFRHNENFGHTAKYRGGGALRLIGAIRHKYGVVLELGGADVWMLPLFICPPAVKALQWSSKPKYVVSHLNM